MAKPSLTIRWRGSIRPGDNVDFVLSGRPPLLAIDEAFASFTLATKQVSLDHGVRLGTGQKAAALCRVDGIDDRGMRFWVSVEEASRADPVFKLGFHAEFDFLGTTTSTPSRTIDRTIVITIKA